MRQQIDDGKAGQGASSAHRVRAVDSPPSLLQLRTSSSSTNSFATVLAHQQVGASYDAQS